MLAHPHWGGGRPMLCYSFGREGGRRPDGQPAAGTGAFYQRLTGEATDSSPIVTHGPSVAASATHGGGV